MEKSTADTKDGEQKVEVVHISRSMRRHPMKHEHRVLNAENIDLRRERQAIIAEIQRVNSLCGELVQSNLALNAYLVSLAGIVGVAMPDKPDGMNAAVLLRSRITELVAFEKQAKDVPPVVEEVAPV